jgi:hypothetical protein
MLQSTHNIRNAPVEVFIQTSSSSVEFPERITLDDINRCLESQISVPLQDIKEWSPSI